MRTEMQLTLLSKRSFHVLKKRKHKDDENLILAECFNSLRGDNSIDCRFVAKYYEEKTFSQSPQRT